MKRAIIALTLTLSVISPSNAYAHSALVTSNPQAGSIISELPKSIWLKFNENLLTIGNRNVNKVSLKGPRGEYGIGKSIVSGNKISVAIGKASEVGSYLVNYRVVSEDGHPVSGSFKFVVK